MPKAEPAEIRFWRYVDKTSDCWLWTGNDSLRFGIDGKGYRISRAAWFLYNGVMPNEDVLHTCKNKKCVKKEHLYLGRQNGVAQYKIKLAIKNGATRYFTGTPCKNGHVAERTVNYHKCVKCARERNKKARRSTPEKRIKANKVRSALRMRQLKAGLQLPYKIRASLRTRLYLAVKGGYKNGSAVRDLGCSIEEFKRYIEVLFSEGMTWENWGRDKGRWHIDHKKPLSAFDLKDRAQFLEAAHYTNLQPLWSEENLSKGGAR